MLWKSSEYIDSKYLRQTHLNIQSKHSMSDLMQLAHSTSSQDTQLPADHPSASKHLHLTQHDRFLRFFSQQLAPASET